MPKSQSTVLLAKPSRERSQIIRNRKSNITIVDDGFINKFRLFCLESDVKKVPNIAVLYAEPQPGAFEFATPKSGKSRIFGTRRSLRHVSGTSRSQLGFQPSLKQIKDEGAKSQLLFTESASQLSSKPSTTKQMKSAAARSMLKMNQNVTSNNIEPDVIFAIYNKDDRVNINILICKHYKLENDVLGCLQKTLNMCNTLTGLKLEFCDLTYEQIGAVKFILGQSKGITELSLDGNPNPRQNFYVLLKGTNLTILSLRFCKITDKGIAKLAEQLKNPFEQTLLAIDLSSNYINDDGTKYLADALRTNRTLLYMNLADNFITDVGCVNLMTVLQKFPLTHDEIIFRRRRNMASLMRKQSLIEQQKPYSAPESKRNVRQESLDRFSSDRKSKSQNSVKGTRRRSKDKMSTSANSSQMKNRSKESGKNSLYEINPPIDHHPYMNECYPENKEIYNIGNFTLTHLNLSYNRINVDGLLAIIEVLKYQKANVKDVENVGLTKILIEGNDATDGSLIDQIATFASKASKTTISSLRLDAQNGRTYASNQKMSL